METKILNFNNQEDIDYIINNPIFKKDFENLCNRYSSDSMDIFIKRPKYLNGIFAIAILGDHIISMAKGEERKECLYREIPNFAPAPNTKSKKTSVLKFNICLYITNVFTSESHRGKGGCRAVIKSLLKHWYTYTSDGFINDLSVMLSVTYDNIAAINCYKYFGFTEVMDSETTIKDFFGKEERLFKMILTKEAYIEKYLLPYSLESLKTKQLENQQLENLNINSKKELKIIDSDKVEDRNFIINNSKLSKEFEDMEFFWTQYEFKMADHILVRSKTLIEKYKSELKVLGTNYFSTKLIRLTASEIFEEYSGDKFSIMIVDDTLVGYTIGFIKQNNYMVKHVRSIMKGVCTKIIQNLVNYYWDPE